MVSFYIWRTQGRSHYFCWALFVDNKSWFLNPLIQQALWLLPQKIPQLIESNSASTVKSKSKTLWRSEAEKKIALACLFLHFQSVGETGLFVSNKFPSCQRLSIAFFFSCRIHTVQNNTSFLSWNECHSHKQHLVINSVQPRQNNKIILIMYVKTSPMLTMLKHLEMP